MKRRDAIKYTAFTIGSILSSSIANPIVAETLKKFHVDQESLKLKHFSETEFNTLVSVIDTILPETESPSASQVGVHFVMDSIIAEIFSDTEKSTFDANFKALHRYLSSNNFDVLNTDEKITLFNSILTHELDFDNSIFEGVQSIRRLSIDLYLNSKKIGEEFLNYLPVPGYYDPCIDLSEAQNKRWSI